MIPQLRVIIVTWLFATAGTVVGALVGQVLGRQGFFMGAIVLGTLTILLAMRVLTAQGWLNPDRRRGATIGALIGFAFAVPLAHINVDAPLIALPIGLLVGIGLLLGGGWRAAQ